VARIVRQSNERSIDQIIHFVHMCHCTLDQGRRETDKVQTSPRHGGAPEFLMLVAQSEEVIDRISPMNSPCLGPFATPPSWPRSLPTGGGPPLILLPLAEVERRLQHPGPSSRPAPKSFSYPCYHGDSSATEIGVSHWSIARVADVMGGGRLRQSTGSITPALFFTDILARACTLRGLCSIMPLNLPRIRRR
jgi:hypothetical protein